MKMDLYVQKVKLVYKIMDLTKNLEFLIEIIGCNVISNTKVIHNNFTIKSNIVY